MADSPAKGNFATFLSSQRSRLVRRTDLQSFQGSKADSFHSYDPREKERYASRINKIMQTEPDHIPLNPSGNDMFRIVSDGKWLCKFLNKCEPGTVDEAAVAKVLGGSKGKLAGGASFANNEVMGMFLVGCKAAGLEFGNVGIADFAKADEQHKEHLVLGVIWQLLRRQLANEIKEILRQEAEAAARAAEQAGVEVNEEAVQEKVSAMAKALKDPETFLCEWVNGTLRELGVEDLPPVATVAELSTERGDVLCRLAYAMAPSDTAAAACAGDDGMSRAVGLVEWASEQGIPSLAQADDLRDTNPRLILPFVMSMFTWHHARKSEQAAESAAAAMGQTVQLKSVYVVRQHWHIPAAEDGSTAGSCSGNTICAFKGEADALKYVLQENICLVGTDPELPHLLTLSAQYATTAGFTEESVVESLGPIPGLLEKPAHIEVDDAEQLRGRVEAWVKELHLSDLRHFQDLLKSVMEVGPAIKVYACDHAQIF